MITVFAHRNGVTEQAAKFDRAWLTPASDAIVWVDLAAPSIPEGLILSDTFAFHRLSVEDAMSERQYPKAEAYDGYLYVILHGIHFQKGDKRFRTHDIDFFVGPNYHVTVHDRDSGTLQEMRNHATRNPRILGEGPVALLHRIVDGMVDSYRPEMEKLEDRIDDLEKQVFDRPDPSLVRSILDEKRQIAGLRRIVTPQCSSSKSRPAASSRASTPAKSTSSTKFRASSRFPASKCTSAERRSPQSTPSTQKTTRGSAPSAVIVVAVQGIFVPTVRFRHVRHETRRVCGPPSRRPQLRSI